MLLAYDLYCSIDTGIGVSFGSFFVLLFIVVCCNLVLYIAFQIFNLEALGTLVWWADVYWLAVCLVILFIYFAHLLGLLFFRYSILRH